MSYWWAGAMLSATGGISSNLGVNTQKYSFIKNAKLEPELQKPYRKQPLWGVGLILIILGALGDFAALGLAAQSIIAPIGAITLVSNVMFAHFWLKERLSKRDILGTCMIILGSTLSVAFGNHTTVTYTMSQLQDLYLQTMFAVYAFVLLGCCAVLFFIVLKLEPTKMEMVDKCQQYEQAILADPHDPELIRSLDARIAELEVKYQPYEKLHPFCYCALSGCLGAQSILFGKMLAEMIGASFRGDNQMIYPLTYVFLCCMLFSIFSQLHFLAGGLRFFDALYVVPVFQCFFISISTLGGACYFQEFSNFGTRQIIFFPIGICLTLTGVYILSSRQMKKNAVREGAAAVILHRNTSTVEDEHGLTVGGVEGLAAHELASTDAELVAVAAEPSVHGSVRREILIGPHASGNDSECPDLIVDEETAPVANGAHPRSDEERAHAIASPSAASAHGRVILPSLGRVGSIGGGVGVGAGAAFADDRPLDGAHHRSGSMPSHVSRPGTGDRAQSRFARRYSQMLDPEIGAAAAYVASDAPHLSMPNTARRSTAGVAPPPHVGSPTAEQIAQRKRSTWTGGRGSIWEAGMAVLGADPIPPIADETEI